MAARKVLIVTSSDEPNVGKVVPYLLAGGAEVIRLNTNEMLDEGVLVTHRISKDELRWEIITGSTGVSLDEVYSVWYRRPSTPRASHFVDPRYSEFVTNETSKFLWCLWTSSSLRRVFVMNSPLAIKLLEFNKPYQLAVASAVGLDIPESLITNDSHAAIDFCDTHNNEVVVKVFGGCRMVAEDGNGVSIYTNRVQRDDIVAGADEFRCMPVFLENYVPKAFELRVTIVGKQVFACRVDSQDSDRTRDDWRRYDFTKVRHSPYQLPEHVREKVISLMGALGIEFGAVDMIVTPNGEHVFLEVNPSGQWGWIERLTNLPISKAVAEILLDHSFAIGSYPDRAENVILNTL